MAIKIDSKLETEMTPDEVSKHQTLSREEKRDRLSAMKFELERQSGRGTADLDQVEARMAAINAALARTKQE
ncbi:hypothetical protein [Hoeflea sp.]|uniref:hypothetical protein n=1 Tax=Hoeflea sp. TaxID=1940281 RepID=UPI00198BC485|nr:hypothetical protein [Hoeflea sp.]MBC7280928.1 hypothetical protein [Hoeflea sp.]